jgi:hypothetical protein
VVGLMHLAMLHITEPLTDLPHAALYTCTCGRRQRAAIGEGDRGATGLVGACANLAGK